jgi:hypothetical protein
LVYIARTQRWVLGFLLAFTVMPYKWINIPNWLLNIQILLVVVILLSIFIQFNFKIDESHLTYQIMFFSMSIYKKVLNPDQIIRIKFKRIGWSTKGASIQVKKGFNIRILHFNPKNVFLDLIDFANVNGISISKTKDYLILEK